VGVFVLLAGYALLFFGSIPAVLLSSESFGGPILVGQDLGFLGAFVSGLGAIPLGVALRRSRAASQWGAVLLIIALPAGIVGLMLVSAAGLVDVAGLPWTVLYGTAWFVLGHHLHSEATGPPAVGAPGSSK